MMKIIAALSVSLLTFITSSAYAEDSPHEFSANVDLTTNYVFRGASQSSEQPAIQGGFDYSYTTGGFADVYLGTWASNVEFGDDDTSIEIDYYGGLTGDLGSTGIGWDAGVIYYSYPGTSADAAADFDYVEGTGSLSYTFEDVQFQPSVSGFIAYSPDYFGEDGDSIYVSGELDLSLPYGFGIAAMVGNIDVDGDKTSGVAAGGTGIDYTHWSIGLNKEISIFTLDFTYFDSPDSSDPDGCSIAGACDNLAVFTVSSSF